MHYVDFEKAFDSVHRESLLEDGESNDRLYEDFECAIIDNRETSDWFKIKLVVKQDKQECVMS